MTLFCSLIIRDIYSGENRIENDALEESYHIFLKEKVKSTLFEDKKVKSTSTTILI